MNTYIFLQHYWWFIVSLLGAILVFLLFVQGGNSLIFCLGKTEEQRKMIINSTGRKWEFTFMSSEANCLVAYAKVWYLTGMWRKKTRNEPSNILRVLKSSPEYWSLPFMSGDAWKGMSGSPLSRRAPSYAAIESAMLSDWSCMTTVSR